MRTLVASIVTGFALATLALAGVGATTVPASQSSSTANPTSLAEAVPPAGDADAAPVDPNGPVTFAGVTLPVSSAAWWRKSVTLSPDGTEAVGSYVQLEGGDSVATLFVYRPAEAFDAHVDILKRDILRMYTATADEDRPAMIAFADGPHAGRVVRFSYSTAFAQTNGGETKVQSKLIAVPIDGGVFVARVTWPEETKTGATSDEALLKSVTIGPATRPATQR